MKTQTVIASVTSDTDFSEISFSFEFDKETWDSYNEKEKQTLVEMNVQRKITIGFTLV